MGFLSVAGFSQSTIWQSKNANLDTTQGIRYMSAVDSNIVWALAYDGTYTARAMSKFTRTIDGSTFLSGTFLSDTNYWNPGNIHALSATTAYISCYSKNSDTNSIILRTTNGGVNWNVISTGAMFKGTANFADWVYFWNANNGICLGDPNGNTAGSGAAEYEIYRTNNAGATWTRVPDANIANPSSSEAALTNSYFVNGKFVYFGTTAGRIFISSDSGKTFIAKNPAGMGGGLEGMAFRDSLHGMAWGRASATATALILKKTVNGGSTWSSISLTTAPNNTKVGINDICVVPNTNAYMSVGLNGASSGYVTSITNDDGGTWTVLETGTVTAVRMLEVQMVDTLHGWAGNFSDNTFPIANGGMNKYKGPKIPNTVGIRPVADIIEGNVYPNPSNGHISVQFGKVKAGTVISVYDMIGNEVYRTTVNMNAVNYSSAIDLSTVQKGMYMLRVEQGNTAQVQKLIIQ